MASWLPEACISPVSKILPRLVPERESLGDVDSPRTGIHLHAGDHIGDYRILAPLGKGSFAKVFLAEQMSLGRKVALKISRTHCQEARLLAGLEHEHIVRVFSEAVDARSGWQLISMQYIPGLALDELIERLQACGEEWRGADLLRRLDDGRLSDVSIRAETLRDRAILETRDRYEAVCLLGARLAEALAHAHDKRILHRDIKPANVLIDACGRPYLADFNLSFSADGILDSRSGMFGGSLAYMSPEHLDAFNPECPIGPDAVDARSDIYSLGVVLLEFVSGKRPWSSAGRDMRLPETLQVLAEERRTGVPPIRSFCPEIPLILEQVIRRCLAHDPNDRFQSALELAKSLHGARGVLQMQRQIPQRTGWLQWLGARPFLMLTVLLLLPQFIGSSTNIAYNSTHIVSRLTAPQQNQFARLVFLYNAAVYPGAIAVIWRLMAPVSRAWSRKNSAALWGSGQMDRVRQQLLKWPKWAILICCAGWLPGALLFPAVLSWQSGPLPAAIFGHFAASFGVSCFVSLTYTFLGVQYVTLELLYPWFWLETWSSGQTARLELRHVSGQLKLFQLLAGMVPLAAALLMLGSAPEKLELAFRLMISVMIIAGSLGFAVAMVVGGRLQRILSLLSASEPQ